MKVFIFFITLCLICWGIVEISLLFLPYVPLIVLFICTALFCLVKIGVKIASKLWPPKPGEWDNYFMN